MTFQYLTLNLAFSNQIKAYKEYNTHSIQQYKSNSAIGLKLATGTKWPPYKKKEYFTFQYLNPKMKGYKEQNAYLT